MGTKLIITYMAQNSFRPYKGKWLMKEFTLDTSAGAVEKGDLMGIETESENSIELATNDDVAIVGIAVADKADTASDTTLVVWVPAEPKAEMIGAITDGTAVVGTDLIRACDVEDHEGADVDTNTHKHLWLVKITVATADGATTAGEGIFRIAQTPEVLHGW